MQVAEVLTVSREMASFRAPYAPADKDVAARLLDGAARPAEAEARIDARATRLVEAIRARSGAPVAGPWSASWKENGAQRLCAKRRERDAMRGISSRSRSSEKTR